MCSCRLVQSSTGSAFSILSPTFSLMQPESEVFNHLTQRFQQFRGNAKGMDLVDRDNRVQLRTICLCRKSKVPTPILPRILTRNFTKLTFRSQPMNFSQLRVSRRRNRLISHLDKYHPALRFPPSPWTREIFRGYIHERYIIFDLFLSCLRTFMNSLLLLSKNSSQYIFLLDPTFESV